MMNLHDMGWSGFWANFPTSDQHRLIRITHKNRGAFKGRGMTGTVTCLISGKMEYQASSSSDLPAIGDWCVVGEPFAGPQNELCVIIEEILPRKSKIARIAAGQKTDEQVLAANVDFAFIVTAVNQEFNIARLHRYIFIARQGNVTPLIVLSKIDLKDGHESYVQLVQENFPDIKILTTTIKTNEGPQEIHGLLTPGSTGVFLGSSGVGKSTITNALLGDVIQKTSEIRLDDDRGRHTTSAGAMFSTSRGAMVIDTPGLREIQIAGDEEDLGNLFGDLERIMRSCRFTNCTHGNEPGCAVAEALKIGSLHEDELKRFTKMQKEADYNRRRTDAAHAANTKKRWKQIHKEQRQKKKF